MARKIDYLVMRDDLTIFFLIARLPMVLVPIFRLVVFSNLFSHRVKAVLVAVKQKLTSPLLTERLLEKQTQRMDFPKKLCLGYSRDAKLRPCFYQYPTGLKSYPEFVQKTHQCKGYTIPGSNSFGPHSLQVKDCRHP